MIDQLDQMLQTMLVSQLPQEYVLNDKLYQCIPREARIEFNKARNQLAKEAKTQHDSKPAALPKQYTTRANLADHSEIEPDINIPDREEDEQQNDNSVSTQGSTINPQEFITMLSQYQEQIQNHVPEQHFFLTELNPGPDIPPQYRDWNIV